VVKEGEAAVEERKALGRQTLRLLSIAGFLAIGLALTGCSNSEEAKDGETTVPSSEEVQ